MSHSLENKNQCRPSQKGLSFKRDQIKETFLREESITTQSLKELLSPSCYEAF